MKPIEFPGCNITYAKDQPEYIPLPAMKKRNGDITTAWELSDEEIAILIATKRIYLHVMTFNQNLQPLRPYVSETEPEVPQFRTKEEIIATNSLETCEKAYYETVEILNKEGADHLLDMVKTLIGKDGALKTWIAFDFEEKCSAEEVETFKLAFEYMEATKDSDVMESIVDYDENGIVKCPKCEKELNLKNEEFKCSCGACVHLIGSEIKVKVQYIQKP